MYQPILKTITTFSGLQDTISEWKSKRLSNEKFKPPHTANNSLSRKLVWMNKSRIILEFQGSCLKQEDKAAYTPKIRIRFMATRFRHWFYFRWLLIWRS